MLTAAASVAVSEQHVALHGIVRTVYVLHILELLLVNLINGIFVSQAPCSAPWQCQKLAQVLERMHSSTASRVCGVTGQLSCTSNKHLCRAFINIY